MSDKQIEKVNTDARAAASLGRAFLQYAALEPFTDRVSARLTAIEEQTGRAPTAVEVSKVKHEESGRARHAVAGYDLVFTPVKSVSVLWGLHPDPAVRAAVRAAHERAVASAVGMLEEHAAFTRTGAGGIAQVDTNGLVAVAFDHYDSRAGEPVPTV
jgi:conjugative relaxase-like TrwC/TraI family protein